MANLTVTHTEDITLNGQQFGGTNIFSRSGINDISKRIITCPANQDSTIGMFQAAENTADGAMAVADVKYIRVTNLDASNPINLSLQISNDEDGAADFSGTILVDAGQSFVMGTPHDGIQVSDANATIITTLVDLESILIDPGANAVSVEVIIAST